MEPQSFPLNDPDNRIALMTSLSPADNLQRLHAALARLTGYVGVTNAYGPMRGERLSGIAAQFDTVLKDVAHRGLLFADARTGQPPLPYLWSRSVDIVLDDGNIDAGVLDRRLDALTHLALDKGSALGLVLLPRPVALDRVAAWTNTLTSKGVTLVPVSALMLSAPQQEPNK
ncbi:divergent polysaccharide deacetylase [mine drainage metagenome]|uniref:Divergent polysaccharide deacetylase n=1 Tax=mine drainage metagenome TaxID=410659 RepID=A0A1J5P471_9ZZZZ